MTKFELVATGGTFDILHVGHKTLLTKACELSNKVIIGLTSDKFAKRNGKQIINLYDKRHDNLIKFLETLRCDFQISKLEEDFGPAILKHGVQALIVSEEMQKQGNILNKLRAKRNLPPVEIVSVPMILAKDGERISTTRIKNSEIDVMGNLLSIDK